MDAELEVEARRATSIPVCAEKRGGARFGTAAERYAHQPPRALVKRVKMPTILCAKRSAARACWTAASVMASLCDISILSIACCFCAKRS
jgi:hypothetical protein